MAQHQKGEWQSATKHTHQFIPIPKQSSLKIILPPDGTAYPSLCQAHTIQSTDPEINTTILTGVWFHSNEPTEIIKTSRQLILNTEVVALAVLVNT